MTCGTSQSAEICRSAEKSHVWQCQYLPGWTQIVLGLWGWNSAASFLHSSFLQAINAVMLWLVRIEKVKTRQDLASAMGIMRRAWDVELYPPKQTHKPTNHHRPRLTNNHSDTHTRQLCRERGEQQCLVCKRIWACAQRQGKVHSRQQAALFSSSKPPAAYIPIWLLLGLLRFSV